MIKGRPTRKTWLFVGVAVAPIMILFGLLAYVYGLGEGSGRAIGEGAHYVELDKAATDRQIGQCIERFPARTVARCVEEAVQASRELRRGEHELVAQRETADWAYWALMLGIAQLPISTLGLVGLYLTIREGQKANAISHEYDRAWLRIDRCEIKNIAYQREGDRVSTTAFLEIEVSNLGNSPATGVTVNACLWHMSIHGLPKMGEYLAHARRHLHERGPQISGATTVIFPSETGRKISLQTSPERDKLLPFGEPFKIPTRPLFGAWGCVAVFYRIQSGRQGVTLVPFNIARGQDSHTIEEVLADPVGKRANVGLKLNRPTAFDIAE